MHGFSWAMKPFCPSASERWKTTIHIIPEKRKESWNKAASNMAWIARILINRFLTDFTIIKKWGWIRIRNTCERTESSGVVLKITFFILKFITQWKKNYWNLIWYMLLTTDHFETASSPLAAWQMLFSWVKICKIRKKRTWIKHRNLCMATME